jgi:hypothetical protein
MTQTCLISLDKCHTISQRNLIALSHVMTFKTSKFLKKPVIFGSPIICFHIVKMYKDKDINKNVKNIF